MSLDKFDSRSYEHFIHIDSNGGNIGTLNWRNKVGNYTLESFWEIGSRNPAGKNYALKDYTLKYTEHFGCFRWTTPRWIHFRFTKGVARYHPVTLDFPTHPW
jgi:hypothetical protein